MDKLIDEFKDLPLNYKREVLINEMIDLLSSIERLAMKRNIEIDKLKSKYYIKNKNKLFENDYYNLTYIYMLYLKEDLAKLLSA
ncbi:MAG: hypothetical protein IJ475_02065 [Bacilli bacterium]|nr:hypothetical protein [Bacilli bacterium]